MKTSAHLSLTLPAEPPAVSFARHAVAAIDQLLGPGVIENLELLLSELVSNSVRHSGTTANDEIKVTVKVGSPKVRVDVSDPGRGFQRRAPAPAEGATSGWGLYLVEEIAERWGVRQRDDRTHVWFELDRSAASNPHAR